jgi:hypothetical protein
VVEIEMKRCEGKDVCRRWMIHNKKKEREIDGRRFKGEMSNRGGVRELWSGSGKLKRCNW